MNTIDNTGFGDNCEKFTSIRYGTLYSISNYYHTSINR